MIAPAFRRFEEALKAMSKAFSSVLQAATAAALLTGLGLPAEAQDRPDSTGISTPLLSRCAGKFGATLREGDQAFPLMSLDGVPWMKIEHAARQVDGLQVADTVTGTGARLRRRGQVVYFRFTCLLDGKGEALSFAMVDLLPEKKEVLPPALGVRGTAFHQLRTALPRGAELRVQMLDVSRVASGEVLAEVVVRSAWLEPLPFVLRLPPETKLDNRRLLVAARLAVGSRTLLATDGGQPVTAADLQQPLRLKLDPVAGSAR
jgi:uncharacterized lipoprotein YbaY